MQPRLSWRFIALATALITTSTLASAQSRSIRIGKTGEIELTQPTWLGTTLLQRATTRSSMRSPTVSTTWWYDNRSA